MNNCNCNNGCVPGAIPAPHQPNQLNCCDKNKCIRIRTIPIPANLGTDAAGQPYAPQPGDYKNTLVQYLANGAIYIYDSNGVYTNITPAAVGSLPTTLKNIDASLSELFTPATPAETVPTHAALLSLVPAAQTEGKVVEVTADETRNGQTVLYTWDATTLTWLYLSQASPYYTKAEIDALIGQAITKLEAI